MTGGELAILVILALSVATIVLRRLTLFVNARAFRIIPPFTRSFGQRAGDPLLVFAILVAGVSIIGSIAFPFPGLWGPTVLVFSVIWTMNRRALIRYLPWFAPVEVALERGDRIVLLGGAAGTLIAYVSTLPA